MPRSKAVIIAPYWRLPGYVGDYRVDRFIRWLSERGDDIALIRGGEEDRVDQMPWGVEITVRDLLGVFSARTLSGERRRSGLKHHIRHGLSNLLLSPDPIIAWGYRMAVNANVLRFARGAKWVISTSPPESPHVAAAWLARRIRAAHIVDMRDGWLDEPLKQQLKDSRIRRWRESRLESRILRRANRIFVTSHEWREMLQARLPFVSEKTVVLTNAYPQGAIQPVTSPALDGPLTLLHAGRLLGSSGSRHAGLLLDPLLNGLDSQSGKEGTIIFLGGLSSKDTEELERFKEAFEKRGWKIESRPAVPRAEMLESLSAAHGLLLLSASHAAIPSKLFEYIPMCKPVLAACSRGSSVWRIASGLPQFFPVNYESADQASDAVRGFLSACSSGATECEVPELYSEQYLKKIFLEHVSA